MMFHGFLCLNMYVFPIIIFYLAPFGWQTLNVVFLFALPIEHIKKALMSEDLVIQGQFHLQLVGRNCIL